MKKKKRVGHERRTRAAQQTIVRAVLDFERRHKGVSPNLVELAEELGYADKSGPYRTLRSAERDGLVKLVRDVRIVVHQKGKKLAKEPDVE